MSERIHRPETVYRDIGSHRPTDCYNPESHGEFKIISIASASSQSLSVLCSIMPCSSHLTVLTVILAIPASGTPIFRDAEASPRLSATQHDASTIIMPSISTSQSATSPGAMASLVTSSHDTSASTIASISTGQHDTSASAISNIPTSPYDLSVSAITISTLVSQQDASTIATPSIPISQQGASMSGNAIEPVASVAEPEPIFSGVPEATVAGGGSIHWQWPPCWFQ